MATHVRPFHRAIDVPSVAWDMGGDNSVGLFLSHSWIAAREPEASTTRRYFLAYEDQIPTGRAVAYLISTTAYTFLNLPRLFFDDEFVAAALGRVGPHAAGGAGRQIARLANVDWFPAVVVTAPYGYRSGADVSPNASGVEQNRAAQALVKAVEQYAASTASGLLAFAYLRPKVDHHLAAILLQRGYLTLTLDHEARYNVEWASFDDFLSTLSRDRRAAIRREIRRFADDGGSTDFLDLARISDEELTDLGANTMERYGHHVDRERMRAGFSRSRQAPGLTTRVCVARQYDRLVGFTIFYERGGTWHAREAGRRYEGVPRFTYLNMMFYQPLRAAIAAGISEINYGPGGAEARSARRCELTELVAYWRPLRDPSLTRDAAQVSDLLSEARRRPGAGVVG